MDTGLFINFLGTQVRIFILFDGQDIYLIKTASPPPHVSTVRPLTNKGKKKETSFNHSPIVPIAILVKHIAIPHGLWPSFNKLK